MPKKEDLGRASAQVNRVLANMHHSLKSRSQSAGQSPTCTVLSTASASASILAIVLVYLILMAQFASFSDPFIILLAIPPGLSGVVLFLLATGTTLNVMSLMGVIMMTGIVVSNSILIVEFVGTLRSTRQSNQGGPFGSLQSAPAAHPDDDPGYRPWPHSDGARD